MRKEEKIRITSALPASPAAAESLTPPQEEMIGAIRIQGASAVIEYDFLTAEEESLLLSKLQELSFSTHRLLDTMDENLSLLEGSIREVRTAHEIAAESNRMARRRMIRDGNPSMLAVAK